jgi:hypothetical protein
MLGAVLMQILILLLKQFSFASVGNETLIKQAHIVHSLMMVITPKHVGAVLM